MEQEFTRLFEAVCLSARWEQSPKVHTFAEKGYTYLLSKNGLKIVVENMLRIPQSVIAERGIIYSEPLITLI